MKYLRVWLALAGITAVEAALAFTSLQGSAMVGTLLALSMLKAGLIAVAFMHLKAELPLLRRRLLPVLAILLFLLLALLPDSARGQCAMCFRTAEAQTAASSRVLNGAILVLAVPALSLFAGLLWVARNRQKPVLRASERYQSAKKL